MAIYLKSRALLPVLLLSAACLAQSAPPPLTPCPAPGQPGKPCPAPPPDTSKPSTAQQFPFPGEPSKPAPPPNSPTPSTTAPSAADQHPFPTAPPPKMPGDDSGGSSSSGSSSSSDSHSKDDNTPDLPPGAEGTSVHRKLPKVKKVQTDDERVDEDIYVAKFYMNDENLQGAYLRAKDAVKLQPDYSLTHFTLGTVAQKMKKKDEAIAEFKTYLKLDPEGEKAKDAQRALDEMQ